MDWQNPSAWVVLVVDDEPDNLEVVSETLEFNGVCVRTAKDGMDALTVLQEFKPNLILLDLSMPKMNGWETRTRIKENPAMANIPVLALTAHAMPGDAERALAAGFDGYLIKPIEIMTVMDDIRKAVVSRPASSPAASDQSATPEALHTKDAQVVVSRPANGPAPSDQSAAPEAPLPKDTLAVAVSRPANGPAPSDQAATPEIPHPKGTPAVAVNRPANGAASLSQPTSSESPKPDQPPQP